MKSVHPLLSDLIGVRGEVNDLFEGIHGPGVGKKSRAVDTGGHVESEVLIDDGILGE